MLRLNSKIVINPLVGRKKVELTPEGKIDSLSLIEVKILAIDFSKEESIICEYSTTRYKDDEIKYCYTESFSPDQLINKIDLINMGSLIKDVKTWHKLDEENITKYGPYLIKAHHDYFLIHIENENDISELHRTIPTWWGKLEKNNDENHKS